MEIDNCDNKNNENNETYVDTCSLDILLVKEIEEIEMVIFHEDFEEKILLRCIILLRM